MTLREMFGERVRDLRKAKKLTQEELGEKAGLHYTYIGSIERAETNLSMDNIEKIARGLGVEAVELFRFSSEEVAVSERDRMLMGISALLEEQDEKTLGRVLRILREVLEVGQV